MTNEELENPTSDILSLRKAARKPNPFLSAVVEMNESVGLSGKARPTISPLALRRFRRGGRVILEITEEGKDAAFQHGSNYTPLPARGQMSTRSV